MAEEALSKAEASDLADDEQLSVLRNAVDQDRTVTQQEYAEAYNSFAECARSAGLAVTGLSSYGDPDGGVTYSLDFTGRAEDEAKNMHIYSSCFTQTTEFIEYAWGMRPSVFEAQKQITSEYLPAIIKCVREGGAAVLDGATLEDALKAEMAAHPNADPSTTCVVTTGLNDALGG